MYFCVKQRDFEGFLIPVRKPPRQVNVGCCNLLQMTNDCLSVDSGLLQIDVGKIDKKNHMGLRDLFVLSGGPSG